MKKKYIPTFLFVCSALLTIGFAVHLYFDYTLHYEFGSSPFWFYIIVRFVEYMILAVICFSCGIIIRNKAKKDEKNEK